MSLIQTTVPLNHATCNVMLLSVQLVDSFKIFELNSLHHFANRSDSHYLIILLGIFLGTVNLQRSFLGITPICQKQKKNYQSIRDVNIPMENYRLNLRDQITIESV